MPLLIKHGITSFFHEQTGPCNPTLNLGERKKWCPCPFYAYTTEKNTEKGFIEKHK